jgi:Mce-associated membrane protein
LTSSADPRRPVGAAGPRRRVAGTRRRSSGTSAPFSSTLVLDADTATDQGREPDEPDEPEEPKAPKAPQTPKARKRPEEPKEPKEPKESRTSRGLWVSAIGATLALSVLAASLVYALRPSVGDADRAAAVGSARTTLQSLLSYSGSSFDKHVSEVTPQLTSPFKDQFTKVAATDIKPMAVKNDATVQAKVYDAGVMDASGDGGDGTTVRVMAFVNQATTTKAQQAPAIDQNRVIATMRKVGDRWLVSELSAY